LVALVINSFLIASLRHKWSTIDPGDAKMIVETVISICLNHEENNFFIF
jgi:hypothetical protein